MARARGTQGWSRWVLQSVKIDLEVKKVALWTDHAGNPLVVQRGYNFTADEEAG